MAVATKRNTGKQVQYENALRSMRAELQDLLRETRQAVLAEQVPEDSIALGSQNLLQDLAVGQLHRHKQLLEEVEAALRHIEDGSYGVCGGCRNAIPARRLQALPWARYCVSCAGLRQALSLN
jgi:DnaK suppressor protein